MPAQMTRQTLFTTGQVDPINFKRTDLKSYLTAAQSLINMEVATQGLARKRNGTTFAIDVTGTVTDSSRLYAYRDATGKYYCLVSNTSTWNAYIVGNLNSLTFYQAITGMPYTLGELPFIDYALNNDVLVLANGSVQPSRIYASAYSPTPTLTYQALNIYPYPSQDFGNINYNNFTVSITGNTTTVTFSFTGLGADPGYTTAWIGGSILGNGASTTEPIGYGIITNVVPFSGGTVTFTLQVEVPFNLSTPSTIGSQYSVRQPIWSAALGWPTKTLFYQNRLWFANNAALISTIAGSKLNQPLSFDVGTGADTDAIVYGIGQSDSGGINWINGGKQLEIYAENYEFACPQETNIALTPSTFSIRQQSSFGSWPFVKPVTYINDSYYVSRSGNSVISFSYNGIGQTYKSTNVSLQATSLINFPSSASLIRGDDNSQDNFIYFAQATAPSVTSFQFASEYQLAALTPATFSTDNSVTVIDTVSIDNFLFLLKFYNNSNTYTIEVMQSITSEVQGILYLIKMDSMVDVTLQTTGLVTGIPAHFNGYNVHLVKGNADMGTSMQMMSGQLIPAPVSGGQCYFYNPNGLSGGAILGILYDVNLTPMYIYEGELESNYNKNISKIFVDYYQSLDFQVNNQQVPFQNFAAIQAGIPMQPLSGTFEALPALGWSQFSTFSITQSSPFDLQITGIGYWGGAEFIG